MHKAILLQLPKLVLVGINVIWQQFKIIGNYVWNVAFVPQNNNKIVENINLLPA